MKTIQRTNASQKTVDSENEFYVFNERSRETEEREGVGAPEGFGSQSRGISLPEGTKEKERDLLGAAKRDKG